jgi:hypothetical protein
VPFNATSAVDHVQRISVVAARELSSAFDDLRGAVSEIERTRLRGLPNPGIGFLEDTPSEAEKYLDDALNKLRQIKSILEL